MTVAKEIMVTKLVTLEPETPLLRGIQRLFHSNVKGAPVVGPGRNYRGIFTERCCLNVLVRLAKASGLSELDELSTKRSGDFMTKHLWMLQPEMDAFDAVSFLLAHRISGAPVVDAERHYLGMFSEKLSMDVLIGAIYDNLPGADVSSYMDPDPGRVIGEDLGVFEVAEKFLSTPYRRLAVVRDGCVVGQISRQNVLALAQPLFAALKRRDEGAGRSWTAADFMDETARTIGEETEIFTIASIFRETNLRRLPVVRDDLLVGQITRKNLLGAANDILNRPASKTVQPLYLPSVPNASPPGS